MTVPSLFNYGFHSTPARTTTIPPSASDRGDGWVHSSGSGGWQGSSSKGVSPAAMSALTLLVFLFFLNILQSCLQDMTNQQNQPSTVMMVSAPAGSQTMREDMATMANVPISMVPVTMAAAPGRRLVRQKRGDPREMNQQRWKVVRPPPLPAEHIQIHTTPPPERVLIQVPLLTPGDSAENRDEEVSVEEGAGDGDGQGDGQTDGQVDGQIDGQVDGQIDGGGYVEEAAVPVPVRPQSIILVRPIVPLSASFRQFAWRAINAIARPLLPLLRLWRSGRDSDGAASTVRCCNMLVCEVERIGENGGVFRTRLALLLRGLTLWSCPEDSTLYFEKTDCRALIADCVEQAGRHTPLSTLATLLERFLP